MKIIYDVTYFFGGPALMHFNHLEKTEALRLTKTLGFLRIIRRFPSSGAPTSMLAFGIADVWWLLSDRRAVVMLGRWRSVCLLWLFVRCGIGRKPLGYLDRSNTPFTVVATAHLTNSTTHFQNYTILNEPKEVFAPKMVACHTMPYPYAVFYCHSQASVNKVYKVELGDEDGDRVEAVAVCHLDTSDWSPNHASFSVLRIKPGTSPVCHFFPADNLVWVPISTSV